MKIEVNPAESTVPGSSSPTYLEELAETRRSRSFSRHQDSSGALPQEEGAEESAVYRPVLRPPTARLCILDDGSRDDGEWVRLRAERVVIGRTEGQVRVEHDGLMSSKHAELIRDRTPAGYRWTLADLGSTNGTFVRVSKTEVRHKNEFVVGSGRYRFECPESPCEATVTALPADRAGGTLNWQGAPLTSRSPSVVELMKGEHVGQRVMLTEDEYWIGRDASCCRIPRSDDHLAAPLHARLYRDDHGRWHVESRRSLNGVWLRVDRIHMATSCQFQLGEQRFQFKIP